MRLDKNLLRLDNKKKYLGEDRFSRDQVKATDAMTRDSDDRIIPTWPKLQTQVAPRTAGSKRKN
jgi:hypothetical protein